MESSKRAVEAYWATRLIDHISTDDDKIAPVYRLDEISDTLRSSPTYIVREMCEYTMKRLGSRSPRVKQKILRMIKFVVGKGGPEFRRQMQRQSAAIRQLFAYKGQVDALRGDALNKAVRDTAHEAIAAIFASDDKLPQTEELSKRIMGFGSTNSDIPGEGKKSLINDVVGFGSASIKQGLTIMSGYSGTKTGRGNNDQLGSYRGPSLRKSFTSERDTLGRFEREETGDLRASLEEVTSETKHATYDSRFAEHEVSNGSGGAKTSQALSQEERLLDTITAPGGMRLQPARENLQAFIANAPKLDPRKLSSALNLKLHSHSWQVRLKALCVLEEILRQKNSDFFRTVAKVFEEDAGIIKECLQSPQTSVREKAKKVLDHLGDSKVSSDKSSERPTDPKNAMPSIVHNMPDLIDTRALDLSHDVHNLPDSPASTSKENVSTMADNILVGGLCANAEVISGTSPDDLFAGVSFHTSDATVCEASGDFLSGVSVDNRASGDGGVDLLLNNNLDIEKNDFSAFSQHSHSDKLADLMESLTLSNSGNGDALLNGSSENGASCVKSTSIQDSHHGNSLPSQILESLSNHQTVLLNPSLMSPTGMVQGYQAPVMMSPNFGTGTLGNLFFQQQLISEMVGLQRFGMGAMMVNDRNLRGNVGSGGALGDSFVNGFDFSVDATLQHAAAASCTTKEDTKAFDFIADHVVAARGPKKIP